MRHKGVFDIKIVCAFRVQFGNVTNGARDPVPKKFLCRNVPVAENAENDGHRQAQPLRGYFFIVLTLHKFFFLCHWCSILWHRQNIYWWPILIYSYLWTILGATHSNYLTQKLCCSGTNIYIGDTLQLSDTFFFCSGTKFRVTSDKNSVTVTSHF